MKKLIYQHYSKTIRQVPANYLIAYQRDGRWICDPDPAADKTLCTKLFLSLFEYDNKYGTGKNLIKSIQ